MADPILGEQQFVPNSLVTKDRARFYRDPSTGAMSVQYSKNGGASWKQFISEPSSLAAEGWIPTLDSSGNVVWKPILSILSQSSTATVTSKSWADFNFPGALYANKAFGYLKVPANQTMECYGAQVSVFSPATASDIVARIVRLQGGSSILVGQEIGLTRDLLMGNSIFSPISMPAGSEWRMTLTSVGSQDPGEFLSCRLLFNVIE